MATKFNSDGVKQKVIPNIKSARTHLEVAKDLIKYLSIPAEFTYGIQKRSSILMTIGGLYSGGTGAASGVLRSLLNIKEYLESKVENFETVERYNNAIANGLGTGGMVAGVVFERWWRQSR